MKYIIKIVTLLAFLLALSGCGSSGSKKNTPTSSTDETPTQKTMDESRYSNIDDNLSIKTTPTQEEFKDNTTTPNGDDSDTSDNSDTTEPQDTTTDKEVTRSIPFPSMPTNMDLNSKYIPPELGE
ncbi:MAG: hypothetical protein DRG78_13225 [Epsilonproteobacteria bacterium]|nr:MAG: hypothetical protein DRG78_13225 [Campylobacterota bacterium]